ncbi:RND transporter [Rhodobacteraceae bacterium WD3A24]|nr:RND transporter [Rhodobacteraceae bacterium WD3A24]
MSALRIAVGALAALGAIAALIWALWPSPVPVDMAEARVAPMRVTVNADGVARIREPWLITAPVSGRAERSPVEAGDRVEADETVVAVIEPADPAFLDARALRQAEAAVAEARAALRLAEVNVDNAQADLEHAQAHHRRNVELAERGTIAQSTLEDSARAVVNATNALEAARREVELRQASLERAQAQLIGSGVRTEPVRAADCCHRITAPHDGTVLGVENVSARLVQAGEPLLTIGDLADIEIEAEILSTDAVRLVEGADALVERWGGDATLPARLRRIEPAAFTRVSALGIEEQRVRVHLDLLAPPEQRPRLGDGYRVFVRIVEWEGEEVLQIPISALFRSDGGWAVFAVAEGRAVHTPVEIGRRTRTHAQVTGGLEPGARVVAFPSEEIADGVRLIERAEG